MSNVLNISSHFIGEIALASNTPIVLRKAIKNTIDEINAALFTPRGTYTFTANPSDGDPIDFNGIVFTFMTVPVDPDYDVEIGAGAAGDDTDLGISIDNLLTLLAAAPDEELAGASYSDNHTAANKDADEVAIVFNTPGDAGNAYTLDTDTANIARSAETLEGGTDYLGYPSNWVAAEARLNNSGDDAIRMVDNYADVDTDGDATNLTAAQVRAFGALLPLAEQAPYKNLNCGSLVLMADGGAAVLSVRLLFG